MIANNVCTNSGWRSVIEVKTGGRYPYFLVTGNFVDGRSLAIDESFGFETDTAGAVWSHNVAINFPDRAFTSSAGKGTNTFMGNVIADSKIGFSLTNAPQHGERTLIAQNRFLNVETPLTFPKESSRAVDITAPAALYVTDEKHLPTPDDTQRGRLAFIAGKSDRLMVVKRIGQTYQWVELQQAANPQAIP